MYKSAWLTLENWIIYRERKEEFTITLSELRLAMMSIIGLERQELKKYQLGLKGRIDAQTKEMAT